MRKGIFAGDNPFEIAQTWLDEAQKAELNDPNAMALATSDKNGFPNVRIVLLKNIAKDSIVFYTNYGSAKANELDENPKAAIVLHWKTLRRQIRLRGDVTKVEGEEADEYFASRHPQSRLGAWASKQSQDLESRDVLVEKVNKIATKFGDAPPRPPFWGGFRITPSEIEFWADGEYRLHDRFRWEKAAISGEWVSRRLYP